MKIYLVIILPVLLLPHFVFASSLTKTGCYGICDPACEGMCGTGEAGTICKMTICEGVCENEAALSNANASTNLEEALYGFYKQYQENCDKGRVLSSKSSESNANLSFEIDRGTAVNQEISVENPLGETTDPREVIATIVRIALIFLGVITLIIFIVSGIMMMTSGGNEERFKKARNAMVYAIIGLAVILASYSILEFIFGRLLTATGA